MCMYICYCRMENWKACRGDAPIQIGKQSKVTNTKKNIWNASRDELDWTLLHILPARPQTLVCQCGSRRSSVETLLGICNFFLVNILHMALEAPCPGLSCARLPSERPLWGRFHLVIFPLKGNTPPENSENTSLLYLSVLDPWTLDLKLYVWNTTTCHVEDHDTDNIYIATSTVSILVSHHLQIHIAKQHQTVWSRSRTSDSAACAWPWWHEEKHALIMKTQTNNAQSSELQIWGGSIDLDI